MSSPRPKSADPGKAVGTGRAALPLAGVAGLLAAGLTLAVADLVAEVVAPPSSPVLAVGQTFIDLTPGPLKDFAVTAFGTHDKLALLIGMAVVIAALSGLTGVVAARRPGLGTAMVGLLGAVAVLAVVTRPDAGPLAAVPALAGVAAGSLALHRLARWLRPVAAAAGTASGPDTATGSDPAGRRLLLTGLAATAGATTLAATGGRLVAARAATLGPGRIRLPVASSRVATLPAGAELGLPGLTPITTPNRDFYRIDTALAVPRPDAGGWRLRLHGLVDRELTLSYRELLALPLVERRITLACVSNEVGGTLAGTASWLGYPVAQLLSRAGVRPDADMVLSASSDGFTASTPLSALTDGRDALLAVGMNGAPLPAEHGFPARLVVPGLYGFVSATKWLVDLEVTRFDRAQAYWTRRGWAQQAPIRTFSRIDLPRPFAKIRPGPVAVAGIAWAPHRGIQTVEVRVDDGGWQRARLAEGPTTDTWRQWVRAWDAPAGQHTLQVRATDGEGALQPGQRRPPKPDGATGWHSVVVTVG